MSLVRIVIICCITLICFSCTPDDAKHNNIENCDAISESEILTEEERNSLCIYNKVYRYQSELYTICECCRCTKISAIVDCDGNVFCYGGQFCYKDFLQEAEYLFSVRVN